MTTKNAVVAIAKETADNILTLSTGARIRVRPVSASLLMGVQNRIKYPPVPVVHDAEKQTDYENPNHPSYIRDCEDVDNRRGIAAMEAIIMFAVELVDGMPDDQTWLKKLETLQRAGIVDLSDFDLENPIDLEFIYKRDVAITTDDMDLITKIASPSQEGVDEIIALFPGDKEQ